MHLNFKSRSLLSISALAFSLFTAAQPASAGIDISIHIGPPALPVYVQPPCPTPGYLWTPGYWAWAPVGYYWVPGVWVSPPRPGFLWTPGYWEFGGGNYLWHTGYWGPHVGFYGGVNYGFGFSGVGFTGGSWAGPVFRYNTAVTSVNTTVIHNTYVDRTVIRNTYVDNHVSFNGPGGLSARPTVQEQSAFREQHIQATPLQVSHQQISSQNHAQFATANGGHPNNVAMDSINGRRFDQQGRIANGIDSNRLTAGETKRLENREASVNQQVHADRQANGGTLTRQERQQTNREQNNLSRSIYDDKHNGNNAQYGNNEVGDRRAEQQHRIAQGVASGQMAPRETARAEQNEQRINQQVHADRQANHGALSPEEHRNVNREQNQESRQIRQEKENGRVAPR